MTKIIEILLIITLLSLVFVFVKKVIKRLRLLLMMKRLGKIEGVNVRMLKNPMLSLLSVPKEPEYLITVYGELYLVRTYNGGGSGNDVHFASDRFTVRFSKLKTTVFRAPKGRFFSVSGFSIGGRIKIVEPITVPEGLIGRCYTEVILFNPAPSDVSYVTDTKTSIKVAFTGDHVYGRRIFTTSTLEAFLDREARRIRNEDALSSLNSPK